MPSPLLTLATSTPSVQIIYDFISPSEERFLLSHIDQVGGDTTTPTSSNKGKNWGWKHLNGRRSMYWGGTILPNSHALIPTPFPKFIDGEWPNVLDRIAETGVYDEWTRGKGKGKERGPNHCLVNEYLPSQGILPHTDGPAYQPCTTTLSLGSHTILSLRSNPLLPSSSTSTPTTRTETPEEKKKKKNQQEEEEEGAIDKLEILVPPRSLLILSSTLYSTYLHGIQPFPISSIESLTKCVNYEGWWEYLEKRGRGGMEDGQEEEERGELEGLFGRKEEEEKQGEGERKKAFKELKEGLKRLDLLSESSEPRRQIIDETNAVSTITPKASTGDSLTNEEEEDKEDKGDKSWAERVKEAKSRIEREGGWKRDKRVSLTYRRAAGKVRDLGGLLSRVGAGGGKR